MILEGYGIRLTRLQLQDIELVRQHRNSEAIRQFMEFREDISSEQQIKWFRSIDNIHNNYMLIESQGQKIGMIHGSGIDWVKRQTANGGIFVWDQAQWATKTPLCASLMMTDMSSIFGLEKTYAKVLKDNRNAIAFNKSLGYELLADQEDRQAQKYVLQQSEYLQRRAQIRSRLIPELAPYHITISPSDLDDPVNQFYMKLLEEIPLASRKELGFDLNETNA